MAFGESEKEYCVAKLQNFIYEGKIDKAKAYLLKYFARLACPASLIVYWSPSLAKKQLLTYQQVRETFLPNITFGNPKTGIFKVREWFFGADVNLYNLTVDPNKPAIFERKGATYVNMFGGYLHKELKKYREYSTKLKDNVKDIWRHVKTAWCSGDAVVYSYVKNWIINMVAGRKMRTCLYNKANQGVGKSIITDFLVEKVLGESVAYRCPTVDPLTSNDNSQLRGRTLFVFEEPPAVSAGSWQAMSNALKHLITSPTFELKEKYKSSYECGNFASFIMNTNNNAVKITIDDRRMVCLDLSNKYQGNVAYFKELASKLTLETGEAFYSYCLEHKNDDWDETNIPVTNSKQDLINESLPDILQFIKEKYLLSDEVEENINVEFKDLYDEYKQSRNGKSPKSKIEVSKTLKNNGLNLHNGKANKLFFRMSRKDLIDLYTKKRWIHEVDEFNPNAEAEDSKTVKNLFIDEVEEKEPKAKEEPNNEFLIQMKKEMEEMKKEMEKLKQENEKLKQKPKKEEIINEPDEEEKHLIKKKKRELKKMETSKLTSKGQSEEFDYLDKAI